MFERIVVAFDGSDCARAAFDFAADLAARASGQVTIVQTMTSPLDALMRSPEPIPGAEELLKRDEEARFEQLSAVAATAPDGAAVEVKLLHGDPGPALIDLIEEASPDLLVAGTRGLGLSRYLLGSVSEYLVEHASCDLLLFREPKKAETEDGVPPILACLDGSDHSRRVAAVGEALAEAWNSDLVLTHVADSRLPFAQEPYAAVRSMIRGRGSEILGAAMNALDLAADRVTEELREGDPREEILEVCRERSPMTVVVGRRGAGRFRSFLLGSTARELVQRTSCPVLIVQPDEGDRGEGDGN